MKAKNRYGGTVFVTAVLLFMIILSLFVGIFEWNGGSKAEIDLAYDYYLLVRDCSVSTAGAVAGESYAAGGAGYLLEQENVVVLACYYSEAEANSVSQAMLKSGIETRLVNRRFQPFTLLKEAAEERKNIEAEADTVQACGKVFYDLANGLERGELTQAQARASAEGAASALGGLVKTGEKQCYALWNAALGRWKRRARELSEGILFAKDLRYLQVEICLSLAQLCDFFA